MSSPTEYLVYGSYIYKYKRRVLTNTALTARTNTQTYCNKCTKHISPRIRFLLCTISPGPRVMHVQILDWLLVQTLVTLMHKYYWTQIQKNILILILGSYRAPLVLVMHVQILLTPKIKIHKTYWTPLKTWSIWVIHIQIQQKSSFKYPIGCTYKYTNILQQIHKTYYSSDQDLTVHHFVLVPGQACTNSCDTYVQIQKTC